MDLEGRPSMCSGKCCNCGCLCNSLMNRSLSGTLLRSVRRKILDVEGGERFSIPGFDIPQVARVDISIERDALREMVASQQETIQDLSLELDEERNASSSAANEAMSMILRLQREKAEIQMEAVQFKRFAEEKMAHDEQELSAMDDLLYKREEAMQALYCEVQAYKHRMMSYGLSEAEADGVERDSVNDGVYEYPPLKCNTNENQEQLEGEDDVYDAVVKYVYGQTPRSRDHLKDLEFRINQLEQSPRPIEKVIVGHSPKHVRRISCENANSFFVNGGELSLNSPIESPKKKENSQINHTKLRNIDTASEAEDKMSDRVYTIDSVHPGSTYDDVSDNKPSTLVCEDYISTPMKPLGQVDLGDPEILKLYMRLQALEADRESMRQAIISMRTDKAQLVLLKEIAQHLCKEMKPAKKMPVKEKPSLLKNHSLMSVFKWIWSFVFWRKRARRSKYFARSLHDAGLRLLLDKGPRGGQWRCLSRIQM